MQKKKSPGEKLRVKEERKMDLCGGSRCYDYNRTWWKKVSDGGWGKLELCDGWKRVKGETCKPFFEGLDSKIYYFFCKCGRFGLEKAKFNEPNGNFPCPKG